MVVNGRIKVWMEGFVIILFNFGIVWDRDFGGASFRNELWCNSFYDKREDDVVT